MNILCCVIHREIALTLDDLGKLWESLGLLMILNGRLIDCLLTLEIEILSLRGSIDPSHC